LAKQAPQSVQQSPLRLASASIALAEWAMDKVAVDLIRELFQYQSQT